MKISRLISSVLLVLGLIIIGKFGLQLYNSAQNYKIINKLGTLADYRTNWIDGTVALSLERSVTQVALAVSEPAPKAFTDLIAQQREISDRLFSAAIEQISKASELTTNTAFLESASETRKNVTELRSEVDALLRLPASDRAEKRMHDLPIELKAEISMLKTLSDLLRMENDLTSSTAIVIARIQDLAWEVREFGGRARTYYAVATLNQTPINESEKTYVYSASKRALFAWEALSNMETTVDIPPNLVAEIEAARVLYFDQYINTVQSLDTAMATGASMPLTFEEFFGISNTALDDMATLSKQAGETLISYWGGRRQTAMNNLILNLSGVLLVLLGIPGILLIVRNRITTRLEATTEAIVAVAKGDLAQPVDQRKNDLSEIAALTSSLQHLKTTLSEAEEQTIARSKEQKMQQEAMEELTTGLRSLADGNLNCRIEQQFDAKYENLRTDFNATRETLNELLGSVVKHSRGINKGASEVSSGSDDLSRRTESQAASLAETATSLKQLTEAVKQSAQNADQADAHIVKTKSSAHTSRQVVDETIVAMSAIKESSDKISQIMALIDDIAFQTNLLALNAGVEAARAGEAGSGFAVVASEVRSLAHRASDAAKEINDLITESAGHVEQGVKLVGGTGSSLSEIVGMVESISGLISDISATSKQQSDTLFEINTAVNELDQVTQQNAAMAEEATAASHELRIEANELEVLSDRFTLENEAQGPSSHVGRAA